MRQGSSYGKIVFSKAGHLATGMVDHPRFFTNKEQKYYF
jgi:hypothetical protein